MLSNVAHPNITSYYGSFVEDGVLNVVMEYADNGSLFQHIHRAKQPFSEVRTPLSPDIGTPLHVGAPLHGARHAAQSGTPLPRARADSALRGRVPQAQIVNFLAQMLLALQHLHDKKILHRDIKTKNVFVNKKMQIKLGDFGLSKMLGARCRTRPACAMQAVTLWSGAARGGILLMRAYIAPLLRF